MAWKKNTDGRWEYIYRPQKTLTKIIQQDWLKEHRYKPGQYPPKFFENIEKELTLIERGYWAYAMDGDGDITRLGKKGTAIRVRISLTDREPIQRLADLYGTSISCKKIINEDWKSLYVVQIYSERAFHFLCLICPYMTEKRKKATQLINIFDPNYHPPKISMNFKQNPDMINPHMGMVAGFFDTEGSVGLRIQRTKYKTKDLGERIYSSLAGWVEFSNTDIRPMRKIKKILETWPFTFKPKLDSCVRKNITKNKGVCKIEYKLRIPTNHHLLFMKIFSPWILITRKREYAEKFERKKQIYKICDENE